LVIESLKTVEHFVEGRRCARRSLALSDRMIDGRTDAEALVAPRKITGVGFCGRGNGRRSCGLVGRSEKLFEPALAQLEHVVRFDPAVRRNPYRFTDDVVHVSE
jgi:hypothetical protein